MDKIIIVDDSKVNLMRFRQLVGELQECEPILFEDPVVGLEWCRFETPDLVLVDYEMPRMNGVDFIRNFRKVEGREAIPVLMVTASANQKVRYEALTAGANDFLNKPVDAFEFQARVKNMLALRHHQRALSDRAAWLAENVRKATAEIVRRDHEIVFRLSRAAEFRDPETGAHLQRMAHFSRLIAANLGLDEDAQTLILGAAPMHDVGKIGIPDQILLKPGRLDPREIEIMQGHARLGYELLKDSASEVLQAGAEIAYSHHERFDGTGYPNALKGKDIPLFGRICAVADVFDALTSVRPYKSAWKPDAAAEFLRSNAGTQFDPGCVDAFLGDWHHVMRIRVQFNDPVGVMVTE